MELNNGRYEIGGIPVEDLCDIAGAPVYVYDTDIMARQVKRLHDAFVGIPLRIMYACKALSNISVLRVMKGLGTGLDTVSLQEVELGLHAGYAPHEILFTPNMVSFEELRTAVNLGVHINIDTISVLERFGHEFGSRVPVCVRVNPHIMAGGNERISTGHIDSKFGISIHQMRHVQRIVATHGIHVNGLHMHTGSDIVDAEVFLQGAEILFETAAMFPELTFVDFGSGFKVPYKPDDISTDIEELGAKLSARIVEFNSSRSTPIEVWFEPGKFLVSESGTFLTRVNVIKQTTATVFAGIDSGLNHLIRPMLYNAYHHIINVSNPTGTPRIYTVVGYICETDTFGWDRKLQEVREGDILAFLNAGAYGYMMSSNYNSRYRPAEILVHNGAAQVIRRRETMDDLLRGQVEAKL
ncbi:MAG: diaminopimelate decarboxylase [Candidatus Kapabacteria bacterium]|nr:diaminopimelate decarboxylase [Candidatus Kapabacteria bacterium]